MATPKRPYVGKHSHIMAQAATGQDPGELAQLAVRTAPRHAKAVQAPRGRPQNKKSLESSCAMCYQVVAVIGRRRRKLKFPQVLADIMDRDRK